MGREHPSLGRIVVVKTHRKHGNGAKGGGRNGSTGKRGVIYSTAENGERHELASAEGTTMKDLARKLRASGFVPAHVRLNEHGETRY